MGKQTRGQFIRLRAIALAIGLVWAAPSLSALAAGSDGCDLRSMLDEIVERPSQITLQSVKKADGADFKTANTVHIVSFGDSRKRFVFKPVEGESPRMIEKVVGEGNPGVFAEREVLASSIDRKLGLGRVPEARHATVDGKKGVAIEFVEGKNMHEAYPLVEQWDRAEITDPVVARALEDQAVFDYLIANLDRRRMDFKAAPPRPLINAGNWLFKLDPAGKAIDVKLIDHGSSFGQHFRVPVDASIEKVNAYLNKRMRFLSELLPDKLMDDRLIARLAAVSEYEWNELFAPLLASGHLRPDDVFGFHLRKRYLIKRYLKPSH